MPMNKKNSKKHKGIINVIILLLTVVIVLSGCYHRKTFSGKRHIATTELTQEQQDSLNFVHTHHYSQNFNFIVKQDSIVLLKGQPEEIISNLPTDSIIVKKGERIAVAEIRMMSSDSTDSVWVQLARDQYTFGWTREKTLLQAVVPDDPISQFISTFSDTHILISLIIISIISMAYLLRKLFRNNANIVLFNDINTFYPTLLTLTVSASATFYSSIQLFAADIWQNFYFHPTLNPFSVTPILSIFLFSVWFMVILMVAVIDEVRKQLPFSDAILYLCSLCGICAICYIVFSITTLYYIGYPLLIAFYIYALRKFYNSSRAPFICGNCGELIRHKGKCPKCGAMNI